MYINNGNKSRISSHVVIASDQIVDREIILIKMFKKLVTPPTSPYPKGRKRFFPSLKVREGRVGYRRSDYFGLKKEDSELPSFKENTVSENWRRCFLFAIYQAPRAN